jgi:3-hydroxy-5-methyl-1-naphthoate 3-O-methyltransferase
MPIIPSAREGRLTRSQDAAPAFMLDFLSAWGFRALVTAFRVGVFDALEGGPKTPAELADCLHLDPKGTVFLLGALDSLGYVCLRDQRYENTVLTSSLAPMVAEGIPYFEQVVFKDWAMLEKRLRQETDLPWDIDEPRPPLFLLKQWRVFQSGMVALANMNIDEVMQKIPVLPSYRHVLDLGGGHGLYSIALCREHQQLDATVFEVPAMERIANQTIAQHHMQDRVNFRSGDFFTDDLGASSMTLLFNVIHSKSESQNLKLVERVVGSLEPGGLVVLLDQFADPRLGSIGRAFGALMALSMFLNVGQQTYGLGQVRDWFRDAGLVKVKICPIKSAPGNALILGQKKA